MNRINLLDKDTYNKIAAGEVVERPSSVIKELIENSIDANSRNIHIFVEDGGRKSIKVLDDGEGIHPDDMEKAFMPHSTSKIKNIDDIYNIKSMGFRGEALPSIASVSKVTLKSKIKELDLGREIEIWGGSVRSVKEVGMQTGTVVSVKDIFYSTPARLKFLKPQSLEFSSLSDVVTRIALGNLNVSFNLYKDDKKVFFTNGNGNLKEAIFSIYGKNFSDNLINVLFSKDIGAISGVIGDESISRGNRNNQTLFINNRYIKNKSLVVAVENAFKSFIMINKFPFFVLNIEMFPDFVDVNVHPQKMEVKFLNEREAFSLVFEGVHEALRLHFKKQNFQIEDEYKPYENILKEQMKISEVEIPYDLNSNSHQVYNLNEKADKAIEGKFPKLSVIGQFNNSYIISEFKGDLYMIDQHAAHEKINFEKYMRDIKERKVISQVLLTPLVIELTASDEAYMEDNKEIFETAGFIFDHFGKNTLALKGVPVFTENYDPKSIFMDVLVNLQSMGSGTESEVMYDKIAKIACKSSVKAMDRLSREEMVSLIDELRFIDAPFTCPHGRPTIIKYSLKDIEKWFKRI
ncbi:MAG: DNA mismatch repair endonuclease MutL [Oscillospiraceae bacterium]|nr:DNA mismatch repair endonuclease MutL [Oscillospiraceae bacterium]